MKVRDWAMISLCGGIGLMGVAALVDALKPSPAQTMSIVITSLAREAYRQRAEERERASHADGLRYRAALSLITSRQLAYSSNGYNYVLHCWFWVGPNGRWWMTRSYEDRYGSTGVTRPVDLDPSAVIQLAPHTLLRDACQP